MKKALMGFQGYIHEIKDPGEDYQIYEGPDATMMWVDAPDDITINWTLEYSPRYACMVWVERPRPYTNLEVARKVGYGDVGEQLGMLFDDLKANGTLSAETSSWFEHVSYIKNVIPKPPLVEEPKHLEELLVEWATREPTVSKECKMSTPEQQSWLRYPGWKNYNPETGMPPKDSIITITE
jgi:hypothetical protein